MERLTRREEEVMEMIWQLGSCAPKDVRAMFPDPKPHINTVATMFQLLEKKGYLTHEQRGRGYIYTPAVYFGNSYMNVVSALVREEKVSEQELTDFLDNLKKQ